MKFTKTLIGIMVLMSLLLVSTASADAPVTAVSGYVTDADSNPVDGANVEVICDHEGDLTAKYTTSESDGRYNVYFTPLECGDGDEVTVNVDYDEMSGTSTGYVYYADCNINVALIDVTIPEFGTLAAGVALVGAIAGFMLYRKKNN